MHTGTRLFQRTSYTFHWMIQQLSFHLYLCCRCSIVLITIKMANNSEFGKTKSSRESSLVALRGRIVGMWEAGKSTREITTALGCCESSVRRWIRRYSLMITLHHMFFIEFKYCVFIRYLRILRLYLIILVFMCDIRNKLHKYNHYLVMHIKSFTRPSIKLRRRSDDANHTQTVVSKITYKVLNVVICW